MKVNTTHKYKMLFKNHHNKKIPYIFYMGIRSALQADATIFVMLGSKHSLMELETKSYIADRLEILIGI